MLFLYGLTILAGIANAIQPGQNATLSKSLGLPITAGLITLLVSTAALLIGGLAIGKLEVPSGQQLAAVPWWAWLGGFLSVLLILAQLYASPAIGAASFLGIIVTVGVAVSILLDHYGWVGFPVHPASLWRILGAVLMTAGVALVALF
ncbi:transporter family-2 protein [Methylobacterium phyllostachyos]|uniref:Transporter family-2 protein n=1 Tax=Methylobacterium phyllostachyos TaxID=582672 RepID=A0A1H0IL07_9HYPH|nr:DMT family transporter [Methylobacterium phyllostachyos]SDO32016.1 transporter family-2 protein [Methylobacterium phyllostachyos]